MHIEEPPIDDSVLLETGRIVIRWARFENDLTTDIDDLMDNPKAAHLVKPMPVGFRRRLDLWHQLNKAVWASYPDYLTASSEIREMATGLGKFRDVLIHSMWPGWGENSSGEEIHVHLMRAAQSRRIITTHRITLEWLTTLSKGILSLHEELASYRMNRMLRTHEIKEQRG